MDIRRLTEFEFRELVTQLHKEKHFTGDPHKMQVRFKRHKNSVQFIGIAYYKDDEPIAFCGVDLFVTSSRDIKGMIHCLGVIKSERGKGLAVKLLEDIEAALPPEVTEILSICNPISSRSHQKAGYQITHPGRRTPTGKISQIRLKKVI